MKALLKRMVAEWEKSLLWVSAGLLTLVIVFQISGLLGEKQGDTTTPKPAQPRRSYLNEATAFAFMQPLQVPAPDARNPFAFSWKVPAQAAPAQGTEQRKAWKREKPAAPPPPAAAAAPAPAPAPAPVVAAPAPPPPPKRAVSILYRGVYKGGEDAGRQLAFVSTQQTPSGAAGAMVAGAGQAMAGVTVKSFTAAALIVTSPAGEDVTIELGQQKKIFLE
jgi:hypothetical protein